MAAYVTDRGRYVLAKNDPTALTWRAILVSSTPANQAAANPLDHPNDITGNELSGTGYARQTIASPTVTEDDTNHWAKFDANDPAVYTAMNAGTLVGMWVVYRHGGSDDDAVDDLVAFLGCSSLVTNGGDVTLSFDANGLVTLS